MDMDGDEAHPNLFRMDKGVGLKSVDINEKILMRSKLWV